MAQAAGEQVKGEKFDNDEEEKIKGLSAAVENYGNFFAQNCFPAASGVVLMQGTMATAGFTEVTLGTIAASSIYIAIISVVLTFIQVFLFDRKIKKGGKK